jgi:hypothetical protein
MFQVHPETTICPTGPVSLSIPGKSPGNPLSIQVPNVSRLASDAELDHILGIHEIYYQRQTTFLVTFFTLVKCRKISFI